MPTNSLDLDRLRVALRDRAPEAALALLGRPSFRSRNEWRWGRRGSLALVVNGPRRGLWHDHERGEGGDLLDLYRRVRNGTFQDALTWARSVTGERPPPPTAPPPQPAPPPPEQRDTARLAIELWRSARETIDDATPAARYLRGRGIDPRRLPPHPNADARTAEHDDYCYFVSRWPPGLRWHAERSALIVGINDATSGAVVATQTIALHSDGTPVIRDGRKVKRTFGPLRGNAARFAWHPDYEHGRWAIAEGCETALAAAQMLGIPCWASLGASNLPHVKPPSWARFATIVADHDPPGLAGAEEAARRYRALGLAATVITPERDGADAADLARETAHAE